MGVTMGCRDLPRGIRRSTGAFPRLNKGQRRTARPEAIPKVSSTRRTMLKEAEPSESHREMEVESVVNGDHDGHPVIVNDEEFDEAIDLDEEDDDEEDEDDMYDIDDFGDLDGDAGFSHPAMEPSEFKGVDKLLPRRSFIGARNMETVKDCAFDVLPVSISDHSHPGNFLGTRSDKVCSGSDDGNFFVWDKDTGRLDGIWEGDGHVVNGTFM